MSKKVAALTVVKDEAAYILDWINHCFYFGFEEVYIAINRSSDKTTALLNQIAKDNKKVKVYNTDWIDSFPNQDGINIHLQYYSFCFLISEALKNQNITHVFPLDADEFWFCKDFTSSISSYLDRLPKFDMLSINWAAQNGDDEPFMLPFENKSYTLNNTVKSVLSRQAASNIKKYQLHIPKVALNELKHIDSEGNLSHLFTDTNQRVKIIGKQGRASMILHRMVRSESEYLALLLRQRPSSPLPIKNNRQGFHKTHKLNLSLSEAELERYYQYLKQQKKPYLNLVIEAQQEVLNKVSIFNDMSNAIIIEYINDFIKVLKGTSKLSSILNRYLIHCDSYTQLRDTAILLEDVNLSEGLKLMLKAAELRPQGPVIKRKIKEYKAKLSQ